MRAQTWMLWHILQARLGGTCADSHVKQVMSTGGKQAWLSMWLARCWPYKSRRDHGHGHTVTSGCGEEDRGYNHDHVRDYDCVRGHD